jgi:hypothetical protein
MRATPTCLRACLLLLLFTLLLLLPTPAKPIPVRTDIKSTLLGLEKKPTPIPTLPTKDDAKCFGLPKQMCHDEQDMAGAAEATKECKRLFCDPLCLKSTWTCDILSKAGIFKLAAQSPYKEALCAEFFAWGCSDGKPGTTAGCCGEKDEMLQRFVEDSVYGDDFPQGHLPMPVCEHDATDTSKEDLLCAACKGAIVISLKPRLDKCLDTGTEDDFSESSVQKIWEPLTLKPMAVAGTHRTLKERCVALQEKMESVLPKLTAAFNERACECMGCCKPKKREETCFFPFWQGIRR